MDKELLDLLVCPESRKPLIWFAEKSLLFCPESKLGYPVRDGIPVMLVEEAEKVSDAEAARLIEEARENGLPISGSG
jgi:hypothetical protein